METAPFSSKHLSISHQSDTTHLPKPTRNLSTLKSQSNPLKRVSHRNSSPISPLPHKSWKLTPTTQTPSRPKQVLRRPSTVSVWSWTICSRGFRLTRRATETSLLKSPKAHSTPPLGCARVASIMIVHRGVRWILRKGNWRKMGRL